MISLTDDPFKGNIDLNKLEQLVQEKGAGQISCIYVELSVNSCGGHPVSLGNLRAPSKRSPPGTRFHSFSTPAASSRTVR